MAGKTTSISMIAGLLEPDAGEVLVAGEPMTTRSVRAKNTIGYAAEPAEAADPGRAHGMRRPAEPQLSKTLGQFDEGAWTGPRLWSCSPWGRREPARRPRRVHRRHPAAAWRARGLCRRAADPGRLAAAPRPVRL